MGVGTGLGLAVCRRIVVEDHGGTLELDYAFTGGARFVIRLPLVAPARPAAPAEEVTVRYEELVVSTTSSQPRERLG